MRTEEIDWMTQRFGQIDRSSAGVVPRRGRAARK